MDLTKELLLFAAVTITGFGATVIKTSIWDGVMLMLIGCVVFIARGYYKKHFG